MEKAKRLFLAFCIMAFTQAAYGIIQKIAIPSGWNLLTVVDREILLQPWTILVYASVFITLVGAGWVLEAPGFILTFKRILLAQVISFFVFWRFSVDYPRPSPSLIENDVLRWGFELMHRIDGPNNTFPSMHVSLTCIVMHQLWRHGYSGVICFLYAALICISTLTTKQHFAADIAGGVAVYLLTLVLCRQKGS